MERFIRKLIKIVEESEIAELEVSPWGRKICIRKSGSNNTLQQAHVAAPLMATEVASPLLEPQLQQVPEAKVAEGRKTLPSSEDTVLIRSPMVGTFYRRPAPKADPYVEVGDIVSPGKVLSVIEALKLMNEIEAEVSGKIVKILVEDAQPVEFNQPLFEVQKV